MAGFSFGAPAPAPTAAAGGTSATGGFSFGAQPAAPAAATPATTATPSAPAGGGLFGGSATPAPAAPQAATIAPAAGGGLFGNTTAPATGTATSTAITTTPLPAAKVPEFESAFPYAAIHVRLEEILQTLSNPSTDETDMQLNGQELLYLLSSSADDVNDGVPVGTYLSNPQPLTFTPPNESSTLRQTLLQNNPNATAHILLPQQSENTEFPFPLLKQTIELSNNLNISEEDATSLFCEISSSTSGGGTSSSSRGRKELNPNRIRSNTVQLFHKLHRVGESSTSASSSGNDMQTFCERAVNIAKQNGTYVSSDNNSGENHQESGGIQDIAQELYFWERGYCLKTLLMLIQHRISACYTITAATDAVSSSSSEIQLSTMLGGTVEEEEKKSNVEDSVQGGSGSNVGEQELLYSRIVLEATDQLLQKDLIMNLINLIKDLTVKNEELRKRICTALDNAEQNASHNNTVNASTGAQSAFGGTSVFGGTTAPSVTNTAQQQQQKVHDTDYAFYEFTCQQRQKASECLFYLIYQTQSTPEEIVALIDLIKDLTNGADTTNGSSGGVGSGLPALDTLKDVSVWMEESCAAAAEQQQQQSEQQNSQQLMGKSHFELEQELVDALWSVRGLKQKKVVPSLNSWTDPQNNSNSMKVEGGKPQLLQCVTRLMLTVVCSFDGKNALMDRNTHGPNSFGLGNALIPPSFDDISVLPATLEAITRRLDPQVGGATSWKRRDVLGFLSASYALLIRTAVTTLGTPRQRSNSIGSDIKNIFRSCLECPLVEKSMTFARLCIIPSLGMGSVKSMSSDLDSDFSFYMSVLSEFTAQYLDVISSFSELPISRARWTYDEEQELQLRQVQENERRQLNAWSGQTYNEVNVAKEIDISTRPDCIDDILALTVEMCSACPDCAFKFWSTKEVQISGEESVIQLEPSRIVRKLERAQTKDPSLLAAYLSFLSAIALCDSPDNSPLSKNGATAVHEWLSNVDRTSVSPSSPIPKAPDTNNQINWAYILNAIRWYTHQLNPPQLDEGESNWAPSSANDVSTAYYYGTNTGNSSAKSKNEKEKSSSVASNGDKKELDENSTITLVSLLSLLSHVALKSDVAKKQILDTKLQIAGSKRFTALFDDALSILFSLLVASINPEVRGSVLIAITNLVRCDNTLNMSTQDKVQVNETGRRCWDLLETCQIIPIDILSQYSTIQAQTNPIVSGSYVPSVSRNKGNTLESSAWFPASEQYGILNEMEHVEVKQGCYPATEGLLRLLTALISTVGCPEDLGSSWRPRPGCAPYIEYVVNFVLPRALGTKVGTNSLHFASPADKARLVSRALEVIDAVIMRYNLAPPKQAGGGKTLSSETALVLKDDSKEKSRLPPKAPFKDESSAPESVTSPALSLVKSVIFPQLSAQLYEDDISKDFSDEKISDQQAEVMADHASNIYGGAYQSTATSQPFSPTPASTSSTQDVPRAKSPGFFVLANVLSSDGSLFETLARIINEEDGPNGVQTLYGETIYSKSLALALFVDSPPDFATSSMGFPTIPEQQYGIFYREQAAKPMTKIKSKTLNLSPPIAQDLIDSPTKPELRTIISSNDAIAWREQTILRSLRILCAAAGRETRFTQLLKSATASISIVPVLRFQPKLYHGSLTPLDVMHVQINKLTKQLMSHSQLQGGNQNSLFFQVSQCVGYQSLSTQNDEEIAAMAISLIAYLCENTSPHQYIQALTGLNVIRQAHLSTSLSNRLCMESKEDISTKEGVSVKSVILNLILSNLELDSVGDENLSHIILGLSGRSLDSQINLLQQPSQNESFTGYSDYHNALDAILGLLGDMNFILDSRTSALATQCFEIIYRLCYAHGKTEQSLSKAWVCKTSVLFKLRQTEFWYKHLHRLVGCTNFSGSVLSLIQTRMLSQKRNEYDGNPVNSGESNVSHSISWLLKGVAIELHALMGFNSPISIGQNIGGMVANAAGKPNQCRRLLRFILDGQDPLVLQTLLDIPVTKPLIFAEIGPESPPREILQGASMTLDGPIDVFHGYEVINLSTLKSMLKFSCDADMINPYLGWAENWNNYVTSTCATSHLSTAWSTLVRTIFEVCEPILFGDTQPHFNSEKVTERSNIVQLLKHVLLRLCTKNTNTNGPDVDDNMGSSDRLTLYNSYISNDSTGLRTGIEPNVLLPLSVACLSLAKLIFEDSDSVVETKFVLSGDDSLEIFALLAEAIACCRTDDKGEEGCHDERAAVLSVALSTVLDLTSTSEMSFSPHLLANFRVHALKAGSYLSTLATYCISETNAIKDAKRKSIALAARSGLVSLINWVELHHDNHEDSESNHFLLQLFSNEIADGKGNLTRLIQLLAEFDSDMAFVLDRIASCHGGTELLINADIMTALVSATVLYQDEMKSGLNGNGYESTAYGSLVIEPPTFLSGHLQLLNSLLASQSSQYTRQRLLPMVAKFVELHLSFIERLMKSYPENDKLISQFITCIHLLFCGYSDVGEGNDGISLIPLNTDMVPVLEQRVIDLALHLAQYPYPAKFLASIPSHLKNAQKNQFSRAQNINIKINNEKCWWENVSHLTEDSIALPDPPFGSSDANYFRKREDDTESSWSDASYRVATSAADCLNICLTVLLNQTVSYSKTVRCDGLSLAIGLSRLSDATQAIDSRLKKLASSQENNLSMMMDFTNIADKSVSTSTRGKEVRSIEQKALMELGYAIAQSLEKLLYLSLAQSRVFIQDCQTSYPDRDRKRTLESFVSVLVATLSHTQMDSKDILAQKITEHEGDDIYDSVSLREVADELKRTLEKLSELL